MPDDIAERITDRQESQASGLILAGEKVKGGILSAYLDGNSGLAVFFLCAGPGAQ